MKTALLLAFPLLALTAMAAAADGRAGEPGMRLSVCRDALWKLEGGDGREAMAVSALTVRRDGEDEHAERCSGNAGRIVLAGLRSGSIAEASLSLSGRELEISVSASGATGLILTLADYGESYFGVSEHPPSGSLGNRGQIVRYGPISHPSRANARAPFYFTNRGFAAYAPEGNVTRYELGVDGRTRIHSRGSSLALRVIAGSDYLSIFSWYNRLAGPPVVPPAWALGPLWWRDDSTIGDRSPRETILSDAATLRKLSLAASAVWIDRPYGTGALGWGSFDFAPGFGSPSSLMSELSRMGLPTLLWVANRASGRMYAHGRRAGLLFPGKEKDWPAMDVRREEAADWFRSELEGLARLGARGFKIDRGDEKEMPDEAANDLAAIVPRLAGEAMRAVHGSDHFVFARNIADTGRRYAGVWSGDPEASFGGLRLTLLHALRASLLGFPAWGSDTGGYLGSPSEELHTRWLAFSAFTPMMEILIDHGDPIWRRFGAGHLEALRRYAALHERLIPYIRSELAESARTGFPLMRPMFLEWPHEPALAEISSQYMLGRSLLVAPVLIEGASSRDVRIPPGDWLPLRGERIATRGPATLKVEAPLPEIPVYVRAGAIIPWGGADGRLEPDFYPAEGGEERFPLLLRDGRTATLSMRASRGEVRIEIPELRAKVRGTVHCEAIEHVKLDGAEIEESARDRLVFTANRRASVSLGCRSLFRAGSRRPRS